MKFYYENKDLSKQLLVKHLHKHIHTYGKKTTNTKFRYSDDCEAKGLIIRLKSDSDARKIKIIPTEKTIYSFSNKLSNYHINFLELTKKIKINF